MVCNFRYVLWMASISLLRYVCRYLHHIAWFLHHKNAGLKTESAGFRLCYWNICSWICGEYSTNNLPFLSSIFWGATSDIFHGWPAYHYWEMYVNFCTTMHDFCTIKMLASKMNLQVLDCDIRMHALGFGESIVPVSCLFCFHFFGVQLQIFSMDGQHIIIEICT